MGATLHELLHGFGLPHESRNDDNFHGNVMGNGLRGWRGYAYPGLYPNDTVNLQRASAVTLNASRFLQPQHAYSDNSAPLLTINGAATFVGGQVRINFTASDSSQLAGAILVRGGESIGEMLLSGTNVTTTFDTPYYEAGTSSQFSIDVYDTSGNKTSSSVQFTPPTSGNHAPQPKIRASAEWLLPGQSVTLSAAGSSDIDAGSTLQVEWDLDGNGTFDTTVSGNLSYTTSYPTPGTKLVRARVRDNLGVTVVSVPIPIRVVPSLANSVAPVITAPGVVTSSQRPVISWTPVSGADQYEIWVSKNPSSSPYHQATVFRTSYTPTVDLGIGSFSLWVRAKNSLSTGVWTRKSTFVINTAASLHSIERSQPTLRPTIRWNAIPGAVKYDVWINDISRGISPSVRKVNVTGTTFTPSSDLLLGEYRVWVRGIASDGTTGGWSTAIDFVAMQAPTITQPLNSTFDRTPTFAWNTLPGAVQYEVYVRNLNTGATTIYERNISVLSFTPVTPLGDGPYRWWGIGISAQGVRSFWTAPIDIYIGGRTEMLSPAGSSNNTTPTFAWRPVDGAGRYDLWVNQVGGQAQIIRQQNLTGTSYTPTIPLPSGTYRAWIRAISSTGQLSLWSLDVAFTVAAVDNANGVDSVPAIPDELTI